MFLDAMDHRKWRKTIRGNWSGSNSDIDAMRWIRIYISGTSRPRL